MRFMLLMLGGAEVALSWLHPTRAMQAPIRGSHDPFASRLHRRSAVPGLLYEIVQNRQEKCEGIWVRTNNHGMRDEAAVLRHKGLAWRPDLIVLGYVLNDPEIDPVQPINSYFRQPPLWQRFNLGRMVARRAPGVGPGFRGA